MQHLEMWVGAIVCLDGSVFVSDSREVISLLVSGYFPVCDISNFVVYTNVASICITNHVRNCVRDQLGESSLNFVQNGQSSLSFGEWSTAD